MSDVIDLDFYRKFRVILPIHPKNRRRTEPLTTRVYRRRRKLNPKLISLTKQKKLPQ